MRFLFLLAAEPLEVELFVPLMCILKLGTVTVPTDSEPLPFSVEVISYLEESVLSVLLLTSPSMPPNIAITSEMIPEIPFAIFETAPSASAIVPCIAAPATSLLDIMALAKPCPVVSIVYAWSIVIAPVEAIEAAVFFAASVFV